MIVIFMRVIAVFMLILIGYVANRMKILPDESRKHLINLMLYITAPCMAASSIYTKELSPDVVKATGQVLIGAAIYFVLASAVSYFMVKMGKYRPLEDIGIYMVAITCLNTGFMGFPVTKAIFGDEIFYLMVMHNIVSSLYLYGAVPILLKVGRDDVKSDMMQNLKEILNPATIGIFVGVIMLLLKVQPPKDINNIIIYLSDMTIPLSMIIIGVQLGSTKFRDMVKNKYVNMVNIKSMILMPILTFLIVEQFDMLELNVKIVLIFASVLPAAVVPSVIAEKQGIKTNKLAEVVSLTTLTSLITIPIVVTLLTLYYKL